MDFTKKEYEELMNKIKDAINPIFEEHEIEYHIQKALIDNIGWVLS